MSDAQTVAGAVEQVAALTLGHTSDSERGDVRGVAPHRAISSGLSAALTSCSERRSNNDPQDFHSSTENVDNSRPPMSRLTAQTLRKAHGKVRNIHRLGSAVPEGLALLERDYYAWRRRVQRGTQRETLLPVTVGESVTDEHTNDLDRSQWVPWSAEVRDYR